MTLALDKVSLGSDQLYRWGGAEAAKPPPHPHHKV
jgi:hypothetical protein